MSMAKRAGEHSPGVVATVLRAVDVVAEVLAAATPSTDPLHVAERIIEAVYPVIAARVRAEAVAEEQQRITAAIWAERSAGDGDMVGKTWNTAIATAATIAADAVAHASNRKDGSE